MKRSEKEAFVGDFRERLGRAPVVYLTDFTGLDVEAMTVLRQNLKDVGAEYLVVKNRLVKRALEGEEDFPDLGDALTGPTGVVFGYEGVVEPAKAVTEFAKEHDDRPVFKLGVLEKEVLEIEQIDRLAALPPRDRLMSELVGALQGPMTALVGAMEGKVREAAGLLEALRREREAEG